MLKGAFSNNTLTLNKLGGGSVDIPFEGLNTTELIDVEIASSSSRAIYTSYGRFLATYRDASAGAQRANRPFMDDFTLKSTYIRPSGDEYVCFVKIGSTTPNYMATTYAMYNYNVDITADTIKSFLNYIGLTTTTSRTVQCIMPMYCSTYQYDTRGISSDTLTIQFNKDGIITPDEELERTIVIQTRISGDPMETYLSQISLAVGNVPSISILD